MTNRALMTQQSTIQSLVPDRIMTCMQRMT